MVGDKNIVRRVKLFCADGSYPVSLGFGLFLEGGGGVSWSLSEERIVKRCASGKVFN